MLACLSAVASAQSTIRIQGSDTMLVLNQRLAKEYARTHPGVTFEVVGGGSEVGIAALQHDKTDIAAASRRMKETELRAFEAQHGARPDEIVVALDGLAIYLHEYNPVQVLSVPQLEQILSGEARNWRSFGGWEMPITVYNRDEGSGTRTFMRELVLHGKSFARNAIEVATTAKMMSRVATDPGGIGYGGIAYAKGAYIISVAPRTGEVGIWPSSESVADGNYPLSRNLYYYVEPASRRPNVLAFLDWIASDAGQELVADVGFIRVPRRAALEAAAAAPRDPRTDVELTPANARASGFQLAVAIQPRDATAPDGLQRVDLRFDPAGTAILRIRNITLQLGDDAVVPLALDGEFAAQFSIRKSKLASVSLRLAEAGAPLSGATYLLRPGEFAAAR
jgi:phosphate transport system substrate-binding protein